ncbi:MAG: alkane 1-monooxygenase [Gordonia paraffinivorans]
MPRDRRSFLWPIATLVPLSALLPSQLVLHTGLAVFWWTGPVLVFVIVPVLDLLVGDRLVETTDTDLTDLQDVRYYRWCTFLFLPLQLVSLVIACYLWSHGTLTLPDKIGLAVGVGIVGGIGINTAHELGHRYEKLERHLAKMALAQTMYGHFFVEHNRGHHVRVATPGDPASARMGETLFRFLPRTIIGAVRSALALEATRLARHGRPWWHPSNHVLNAWLLTVVLFGALTATFGVSVLPMLLLQACVGIVVLESVNYVEHYGLLRATTAGGRLERCAPEHSWNSDRLVTNIVLFHVQRHSDHHANPRRRYQTLRSCKGAPQLPAGYPTMILLAAVPPLFSRIMDPIVLRHYGGDISRANVSTSRRGVRLRRRHGGR